MFEVDHNVEVDPNMLSLTTMLRFSINVEVDHMLRLTTTMLRLTTMLSLTAQS